MTDAQEAGSEKNVVIVGSGIFGMSTALWMLKNGSYNVTVLDKCGILPAPDAASTDLNKIIRAGDYDDPGYAALSIEAIEEWRKPEWEETYHESGVMLLTTRDSELGKHAVSLAQANLASLNIEAQLLDDSQAIKRKLGGQVPTGDFENRVGYSNPIGGWAEASRAVEVGLKRIRQMGGLIRGGAEVVGLVKDGRKVRGVVLDGGEEIEADLVVIAAGAWTPALFSSPGVAARFPEVVASGQTVAHIQLTPEEVETYSKIPVILNKDDGFYTFPPSAEGIFKFAQHGRGYTNPIQAGSSSTISVPRTKLTPGAEDGMIPLERVNLLRRYLADYYPELAKKDFMSTRLCWYCDTHSGDWLIDYHPDYENLFIATGGSGHAFKYAPIIGREILDVIEGKPNPTFADRWAFGYVGEREPRVDDIQVLKVAELARPQDLLVSA